MKSYGFREELLEELSALTLRVLVAEADEELLAIPEPRVRAIHYEPRTIPWIVENPVVAVFMVRGEAYALTDPLLRGKARRIAIALNQRERFVAVGVDRLLGVWEGEQPRRQELRGARYPWAQESLVLPQGPALFLDPESYLNLLSPSSQ